MSIIKGKVKIKNSNNTYDFILPETTLDQVYDNDGKLLPEIIEELKYQKNIGIDQGMHVIVTDKETQEVEVPMTNYKPELHVMNIIVGDKILSEDQYQYITVQNKVRFTTPIPSGSTILFMFMYLKRLANEDGQLIDGSDIVDASIDDVKIIKVSANKIIETPLKRFITDEERKAWNKNTPIVSVTQPATENNLWFEEIETTPYVTKEAEEVRQTRQTRTRTIRRR